MKETEEAYKAEELKEPEGPKEVEKSEKKLTEAKTIRHAVWVDLMAMNNQVRSVRNNKWDKVRVISGIDREMKRAESAR